MDGAHPPAQFIGAHANHGMDGSDAHRFEPCKHAFSDAALAQEESALAVIESLSGRNRDHVARGP